jgi:CDP-4-dehydro-6-deoxyglucose reductase
MKYSIKLLSSERALPSNGNETIVQTSIRHGVPLRHGCNVGACRTCKVKLIEGTIKYAADRMGALTSAERAQGLILPCCAYPTSDVSIETLKLSIDANGSGAFPGIVTEGKRIGNVMKCTIRLPRTLNLHILPGQYIQILWNDGCARSFSVANWPRQEGTVEFHIQYRLGGSFSEYAFHHMKVNDVLRLQGPFGQFVLRKGSRKPIIFVGMGTGFAPIQALVEQVIREEPYRKVWLYWGGRTCNDMYFDDRIDTWRRDQFNLTYVPVLSRQDINTDWIGRRGYVWQSLLEDISDFSQYEIYACGSPEMVQMVFQRLKLDGNLRESDFFSDCFFAGNLNRSNC